MPPSTTVQPARATVAFPGTTALRTLAALRILLGAVLLWAFMAGLLLVGWHWCWGLPCARPRLAAPH